MRLVNKCLSHLYPEHFKLLLLCCITWAYLLCWLLKVRDSVSYHPLPLPDLNLLILKVSGIKPCWFSKSNVMGTCLPTAGCPCQMCLVWGMLLSPFSVHVSHLFVFCLPGSLILDHLSPPYPFQCGILSMINCRKSVVSVFSLFSLPPVVLIEHCI